MWFPPHPQLPVCSRVPHTRKNTILANFLLKVGRGCLTYTLIATKQTREKLKVTEAADRVAWSFRDGLNTSAGRSDKGIMKLPSEPSSKENGWVWICSPGDHRPESLLYTSQRENLTRSSVTHCLKTLKRAGPKRGERQVL